MSFRAERNTEPAAGAALPEDPDAALLPDDRAVQAGGGAGAAAACAALHAGGIHRGVQLPGQDFLEGGEGIQRSSSTEP